MDDHRKVFTNLSNNFFRQDEEFLEYLDKTEEVLRQAVDRQGARGRGEQLGVPRDSADGVGPS